MATSEFLADFHPVPTEAWEAAIREKVPPSDYAAKTIWHAEPGLDVKAFYRAEDLSGLQFLESAPGEYPYVRGARRNGDWRIREEIDASDPEEANRAALDAVAAGAEEISFLHATVASQTDLGQVLANLNEVPVRFHGVDQRSARLIATWLSASRRSAGVSADLDALADLDLSAEVCCKAPRSRMLTLAADDYEESGLGAIEQIALLLSRAVEFLQGMLERGLNITQATQALDFSFVIGPKFFVEIAKLRAFRLAWAKVVESFGGDRAGAKAIIYARTARWNETVYDPHVNVLRATTEAIAGILGGADSIVVAPFDECYRKSDEASRRLARNVQLVLKRESLFGRVADPLGGAYAIEALTNNIASEAWTRFQELERAGGYRKAEADGVIASLVARRTADRDALIKNRRLVLTGTTRFADAGEKALDRVSIQSDLKPRAASTLELLRFRTEIAGLAGNSPRVLLVEFGDSKMRGLRAQFAADFLACAGLTAKTQHVEKPEDVEPANVELIVLCSSDAEYLPFVDSLKPMLAQRGSCAKVVIAGKPSSAELFKQSGIEEFIYLGCDAVEVLDRILQKLGMKG